MCALGEQLPCDEVAVVLHLCQDNEIICMNIGVAPAIRDEVNALSGIAREDNLFALRRIDETSNLYTRIFHHGCSFFTEMVDTAMHISMRGLVVHVHRFY